MNFEKQMEQKERDHTQSMTDLQKAKDKELADAQKREKELMRKITELQNEITILKTRVGELEGVLSSKDYEIQTMQNRVKEAEAIMEREKQICKERIHEIEHEFNEKERNLQDRLKRDMNQLI